MRLVVLASLFVIVHVSSHWHMARQESRAELPFQALLD
jgi:hypothetical protein